MSHGHAHGGEPCDGNHGNGGGGIRHRGTRQAPLPDPEKDKAFAAEAFKRMADIDRNLAKKQPNPRHEFWFVLSDPCGLVCAIITHFVVQFVNYVTVVKVIAPWLLTKDKYRWAFAHIFFFETIIVFIVLSHLKCMLSDPGSLTHLWNAKKMEKIKTHMEQYLVSRASGSTRVSRPWCAKCDNYKPVHTHHCSYCGTCVEGFDHHCPWMNNCVGKRNHKFFMLFLLYVGSGSGYAIVMTVYRMWSCMKVTPVMARAMDVSFFSLFIRLSTKSADQFLFFPILFSSFPLHLLSSFLLFSVVWKSQPHLSFILFQLFLHFSFVCLSPVWVTNN